MPPDSCNGAVKEAARALGCAVFALLSFQGRSVWAQGWDVTTEAYVSGFAEPSCLDFQIEAPAATPLGFDVHFRLPTYYIEVTTEKEKTLLFPPYGTKLLQGLADATRIESSKKVVSDAILGLIPGVDEQTRDAVSILMNNALGMKGRAAVNAPTGSGLQVREVHVWKYNNPEFFSELFQVLLCHAAAAGLDPVALTAVQQDYPISNYYPPNAAVPVIFPVYFSEVDWVQWNMGLFDLSLGEGLGLGDRIIWRDSSGRELGLTKYSRKGLVYDSDPVLSSFHLAMRGFSRAASALGGKLVTHGDVFSSPGTYKFNVIAPRKTGCFSLEEDPRNRSNLVSTVPDKFSATARESDPASFARHGEYAFLSWTDAGNTESLQKCLLVGVTAAAGKAIAEAVLECAGVDVASLGISAGTCEWANTVRINVEKVGGAVVMAQKLIDIYQDIKQAIEFIQKGVECIGDLGGELKNLGHSIAKADPNQIPVPQVPQACVDAFGGKIGDVLVQLQKVLGVAQFAKTVGTMAGQALGGEIKDRLEVKCRPGDPAQGIAPEDPFLCAVRTGDPEACNEAMGGGLESLPEIFLELPPGDVASVMPHMPVQTDPGQPVDPTPLNKLCGNTCPLWMPPQVPSGMSEWEECYNYYSGTPPQGIGRPLVENHICELALFPGGTQGYKKSVPRANITGAFVGRGVRVPAMTQPQVAVCQGTWREIKRAQEGRGMVAAVGKEALEGWANQSGSPVAGCASTTGKPKPGEIARCAQDLVFDEFLNQGSDGPLAKEILRPLPAGIQEKLKLGMDQVKAGKELAKNLDQHPEVQSAVAWSRHEYDLKRWERRGRVGSQPIAPDDPTQTNPLSRPKDLCGLLEDAGKKGGEAWGNLACDEAAGEPRRKAMGKVPKPSPLCGPDPDPAAEPNGPLWCVEDFDYSESLVNCAPFGDLQPAEKGLPYSMFDQYVKILEGAGKTQGVLKRCTVEYCTDRGSIFSDSHRYRMRKCALMRMPDGSTQPICTCTGFPDKYDPAKPATAGEQDHSRGSLYGETCRARHPGVPQETAESVQSPIAECEPTCDASTGNCQDPPTEYQMGTDVNGQPIMVPCPAANAQKLSYSTGFRLTPPDMCLWQ